VAGGTEALIVERGSARQGARRGPLPAAPLSASLSTMARLYPRAVAGRRRALRVAWFFVAASTSLACGHDWDPFDPRLEDAASTASSGSTGGGVSVSSGGSASSSSSASTASGGSGGGGAASSGGSGGIVDPPVCGNGVIESAEECDDENDATGDGCAACLVECSARSEVEDPATHHCYRFTVSQSWDNALADCTQWGGHLAAITSLAEIAFVRTHLKERTWIGGSEKATEGTWVWQTGEPWAYAPWNVGEPNNGGANAGGGPPDDEDCLELYDNVNDIAPYGFADSNCPSGHVALCERWPVGTPR
jgi:cysteine-rich repeat protein